MKTENQIAIIVAVLILILVSTGIFVIYGKEDPNEYIYNEFRVFKNPTIGYTIVAYINEQPYHLQLRNDPKSTENITLSPNIRELILLKEATVFTLDPDFNSIPVLGASEMATILGRRMGIYNKRVFGAVTREPVNGTETTIVDCNNVNQKLNVIRLQIGPETKVFLEKNNCIIVQGTDEWEIVRASDRLIYNVLEVIKD